MKCYSYGAPSDGQVCAADECQRKVGLIAAAEMNEAGTRSKDMIGSYPPVAAIAMIETPQPANEVSRLGRSNGVHAYRGAADERGEGIHNSEARAPVNQKYTSDLPT